MRHSSVAVENSIEFINVTEINPLISKCNIKVCYVGDTPNRNKSIITKEAAMKMAPSLRGCAIVGFYNEEKEDFEEHNRTISVSNGRFEIKDAIYPKNTAAAIPLAVAAVPPVKAPIKPSDFIFSITPFASKLPNPVRGTVAPQPAKSTSF